MVIIITRHFELLVHFVRSGWEFRTRHLWQQVKPESLLRCSFFVPRESFDWELSVMRRLEISDYEKHQLVQESHLNQLDCERIGVTKRLVRSFCRSGKAILQRENTRFWRNFLMSLVFRIWIIGLITPGGITQCLGYLCSSGMRTPCYPISILTILGKIFIRSILETHLN